MSIRAPRTLLPVLALFTLAPAALAQTGACCAAGVCTQTSLGLCVGTFQSGAACTPNFCSVAGVCCRGATCDASISAVACSTPTGGAGSQFIAASACNTPQSRTAPCCYADYNKQNGITIADIFDYLNDWFAASPYAKVGGNGQAPVQLEVQDIFTFLNVWFQGGC